MNVKLLRKVKKHILEEPRRFRMSAYLVNAQPGVIVGHLERNSWGESTQAVPSCGTVGCIAGWAWLLGKDSDAREYFDLTEAREVLEVEPLIGNRLFDLDSWPEKFRELYAKAKSAKTRVKIAAERIEHFIKTKGME